MQNTLKICAECGASVSEGERHYMSLPLPDIIDRYTITKLKMDRFSPEQRLLEPLLEKELATYDFAIARIRQDFPQIDRWVADLYEINNTMWDLEWSITACVNEHASPEKAGDIALRLRTENNKRAKVRNVIVHETGHGFFDHKIGHASEVRGDVFLTPPLPEDHTFKTAAGAFTLNKDKDAKTAHYLSHGPYPQDMLLKVADVYVRGGSAVDIGAHVGTVAIPLSRVAKKVIAFEANPVTFGYLQRNVALNAVSTDIRNKGLSDVPGRASVKIVSARNSGAATLEPGSDVEVATLDSEVKEADFIKIDVEGMELSVLRGGERLVARSRPVIWFEVNLRQLRAHGVRVRDLESWLTRRGYRLYAPIETEEELSFGRVRSLSHVTFLMTPRSYLFGGACATFNVLALPEAAAMRFPVRSYLGTVLALVKMHIAQKVRRLVSRFVRA